MLKKIKEWIAKKKREKYLRDLWDIDKQIHKAQTVEQIKMLMDIRKENNL